MSAYAMADYFYTEWYRSDVSPNMSKEQKTALAKKISELTLEAPIWQDRKTNYIDKFPELATYSHSGRISGMQLVSVMTEIVHELQVGRA